MSKIITYAFAHTDGTIDLCERHAEAYVDAPLGPAQHGLHRGSCEECEADAYALDAARAEVRSLLDVETTHPAPDARRVLKEERQTLWVTLTHFSQGLAGSTRAKLHAATKEGRRVRKMWETAPA